MNSSWLNKTEKTMNNVELNGVNFEITGDSTGGSAAIQLVIENLQNLTLNMGKVTNAAKKAKEEVKKNGFKELGENAKKATPHLTTLFNSLKRIAMYRFLRTIIKEITSAFKEGIQNAYQYSKILDGEFARSMDRLATSSLYLKNSIGAMVMPIINILTPAIDFLIDKFVALLNIVNQVFSLISGAATWTKALRYPKEFAEAAGGATAKVKELKKTILGFDEINKLTKQSTPSGGGGANALDYSKMFEEAKYNDTFQKIRNIIQKHLDELKILLLGAAFVVGAILTLTGANIPVGLGLMAIGAYGLAKAYIANWGGMSKEIAGALSLVLGVVGGFSLALGLILLLSGASIPAGLGLMVLGATSMAASISVNWRAIEPNIQNALNSIVGIASGALLALGVILAWSGANIPLGIAMIAAGAVGIVSMVAINWQEIPNKANNLLQKVTQIASASLLALGVIILFSTGGFASPLGVGLILAGAIGLAATAKIDWNAIPTKITELTTKVINAWDNLKKNATNKFEEIKKAINDKVESIKRIFNFTWKFPEIKLPHIPTPHFEWKTLGVGRYSLSYPSFSGWYAQGGFPTTGDLFMANEKGAEMVGSMNGRTTVANNQQIVDGIRQGVRDANQDEVRLLREQNDLLRELIVKSGVVNIPLHAITDSLERKNQRDGGTFVPVG